MAKNDRAEVKKGMDDILGGAGMDLVGQVIASDRKRSGRGEETTQNYDNKTSNNVIPQYDNKTSHNAIKQEVSAESHKPIRQERKTVATPQSRKEPKPQAKSALEDRIQEAARMAESPTMTVTLRIPQEMNDWLDTYVHGAWPEKVKKQELVVEGLRLLIARRGKPKEEVIQTELLPNDK